MPHRNGSSDQQETKGTSEQAEPDLGRTIADLFHEILTNPRRGFSLLVLFAAVILLTLFATWGFIKLFDVQTSEIRLGGTDPHVLFQSIGRNGGEYLIIVSPEGWQTSGIPVRKGDRLMFTAGGKICIDLGSVSVEVGNRWRYEKEWEDKLNIRREDPTETRLPEDYFTPEQRKQLTLVRPWVGPDGFSYVPPFRARINRFLLPDKRAGGLVAAVNGGSETPSREDSFFVGERSENVAKEDGVIWFTVNDVQSADPSNPNLFYNDNIGSFWVKVVVKRE